MALKRATLERRAVKLARLQHLQRALDGRPKAPELQVRASAMGAATGAALLALDEWYDNLAADCEAKTIKRWYREVRADVMDDIGRPSRRTPPDQSRREGASWLPTRRSSCGTTLISA